MQDEERQQDEADLDHQEQQQLAEANQLEQPQDGADQLEQQQDGADPVYAELEPRAQGPEVPVRRPRSRRGRSDPQLPTRVSGRFRGPGDEPLVSLPYTGRPL